MDHGVSISAESIADTVQRGLKALFTVATFAGRELLVYILLLQNGKPFR